MPQNPDFENRINRLRDGRFGRIRHPDADAVLTGIPPQWGSGRAEILNWLRKGNLEVVEPDDATVEETLLLALRRFETARYIAEMDPEMAYTGIYDAARMVAEETLNVQGLRAGNRGGHHLNVTNAFIAQAPSQGRKAAARLETFRTLRNDIEYRHRRLTTEVLEPFFPAMLDIIDLADFMTRSLPVFEAPDFPRP